MLYLLLILIVLACVLLIFIILAQNPKGGGLSGTFGGTATQFLGARQSTDFMEKATWYFGLGILVVVVFTYFLTVGGSDTGVRSKVQEGSPLGVPTAPGPQGPAQEGAPIQMPAAGEDQRDPNQPPASQLPTGDPQPAK